MRQGRLFTDGIAQPQQWPQIRGIPCREQQFAPGLGQQAFHLQQQHGLHILSLPLRMHQQLGQMLSAVHFSPAYGTHHGVVFHQGPQHHAVSKKILQRISGRLGQRLPFRQQTRPHHFLQLYKSSQIFPAGLFKTDHA